MNTLFLLLLALAMLLLGCPQKPEPTPAPKADAATAAKTVDAAGATDLGTKVTTTAKAGADVGGD